MERWAHIDFPIYYISIEQILIFSSVYFVHITDM